MRNFQLFIILLFSVSCFFSCKKENQDPTEDDKLNHCQLNPFLPIDTNKVWVYNKMVKVYDDVITDGIDETTTTNTPDTTWFNKECLMGEHFTRKFNENFYFTTEKSIAIVVDSSFFLKDIAYVTIAYTSKTDTTWQQIVNARKYTVILTFNQSLNKDNQGNSISDELLIKVRGGEYLTLYQSYVFKKSVGLVNKQLDVMNTEIEYSFVKTHP